MRHIYKKSLWTNTNVYRLKYTYVYMDRHCIWENKMNYKYVFSRHDFF